MQYFRLPRIYKEKRRDKSEEMARLELHIDNTTLIRECRNGDKEALNLFYLRFAPRMLGLIRHYISNYRDA